MRFVHAPTRTAAALALAAALGTAAPATAKPIDLNTGGAAPAQSYQVPAEVSQGSPAAFEPQHSSSGSSDWAYVAIGGGVLGLGVIGLGGTLAFGQRRSRRTRSTIAA